MSKQIEVPEDLTQLSESDALYLHQRGRLTDEQLALATGTDLGRTVDGLAQSHQPPPLDEIANTGDANTAGITKEELEILQQRRAAAEAAENDDEDEDDDDDVLDPDDYESATNDQLRAELARRELDVSGRKDELIERLREDDTEEE